MWRRVRVTLRRARAVYHLVVPRQLPNGVIPWRTPILTLAVWTPVVMLLPVITGAPSRDIATSPRLVLFIASIVWVRGVRYWVSAFLGCYLAVCLTSLPLYSLPDGNVFEFIRMLVASAAGLYAFAALSRWDAPALRAA